ncbi:ABC transporter permease subunit [Rhodospirillaceae bacterium SYSU D60014]|uniref:ABC transporter permease n=1 Tax=Virgifigura deserti TaxID=2268457 RepID=UPI000E66375B
MFDLQGYGWMILDGARLTVLVGLASMVCAIVVGLVVALAKLFGTWFVRGAVEVYTTIVRGVPELVLLLLVYYGVPTLIQDLGAAMGLELKIAINPFLAGVGTITFIYGAFASEVFRASYLAVSKGQVEAARALGFNGFLVFRLVVLPQMLRYALPGLGNVWMVLIKATALISVIQLPELMRSADVAARTTRMPFTFFFVACLIYLAITLVSMWLQSRAEAWANRGVEGARL